MEYVNAMIPMEDFKSMDYNGLLTLLGNMTKQYTSELAEGPNHTTDDEMIYFINLLIKEIKTRELSEMD